MSADGVTQRDLEVLMKARSAMVAKAEERMVPYPLSVSPMDAEIAETELERLVAFGLLYRSKLGLYMTTSAGLVRLSTMRMAS